MNILQKLADNKIGFSLAIVHWLVLFLVSKSFFNSFTESHNSKSDIEILLFIVILITDLPAMIPAALLWLPVYIFAEDATNLFYGFALTSFFTITFQWLFIGKAVYNTFSANAAKPISLSLND